MNAIYECRINHSRFHPKQHQFSYPVFMLCIDLQDLPHIAKKTMGLSHNRWNLFSIDDTDHINLKLPGGIAPNLLAWLEKQGKTYPPDISLHLVTFPRVLGYGFNPVSFYFIGSREEKILAVVAEVVNTFREMKLYLVDACDPHGMWHRRVAKNFYVSPFSDPGLEFDFKIGAPGAKWHVSIDVYEKAQRVLHSSITGEVRSLSSRRIFWYFFKYPFLSLRIIGLIHWHAFLLWKKKIPFFQKHHRQEAQCDVLRPHPKKNNNHD
ncbi:MAG: DUF1365 domain-containing protein [Verrucomicrobiae bacterium]|jgi:hypothetical protein|nr:DUF1365 domain-containing protein [Verrucomicrobiae bacterium]